MKHIIEKLKTNALTLHMEMHQILSGESGEYYVSDGVKIITAVVLGALLLAALTLIFNDTIIPKVTQAITDLFN